MLSAPSRATGALIGLLFSGLLLTQAATAQPDPIKYGKIDPQDLGAAPFAQDTGAAAVVLADFGRTHFEYQQSRFRLVFERLRRVKILNDRGFEYATVRVPLYRKNSSEELFTNLKAATYNLEAGKLVKTDFKAADLVRQPLDANHAERRFTLPAVKAGSVIEYSYTVTSDFLFNLPEWWFQEEIPVRLSEYRVQIPRFLDYTHHLQGYVPLQVVEKAGGTTTMSFLVARSTTGGTGGGTTAGSVNSEVIDVDNYRWVGQQLPAFRTETFITTPADYLTHVDFQLKGTQFPGESYKDMAGSWPALNQRLILDEHFGSVLGQTGALAPDLKALKAEADPTARAAAVVGRVRQAIAFDGQDQLLTTGSLRAALDRKRGNAAEVNLLLVSALREAGLTAYPVILSTRDNGSVADELPLLDRFNFVLALVEVPGKGDLLLDATETTTPVGMLPERCLNTRGRVIADKDEARRWVAVTTPHRYTIYTSGRATLAATGAVQSTLRSEFAGYASQHAQRQAGKLGAAAFATQQAHLAPDVQLRKHRLTPPADPAKSTVLELELAGEGEAQAAPTLYFPLNKISGLTHNPFQAAERQFPVELGAPTDETLLLTLTLPDGYQIESSPAPLNMKLPNEGGGFQFVFTPAPDGHTVQVMSRLTLRQPFYQPEEYASLRDLYGRALAKHAEALVIKRKS